MSPMNDRNSGRQMLEMPPVSKKRAMENQRNIEKRDAQSGIDTAMPPLSKAAAKKAKKNKNKASKNNTAKAAPEKNAAAKKPLQKAKTPAAKTSAAKTPAAGKTKSGKKPFFLEKSKAGKEHKAVSADKGQRSLHSVGHPDDMYLNESSYVSNVKPIDIQNRAIKNKSKVHKADGAAPKRHKKSIASYSLYIIMFTVIMAVVLFVLSKTVLFNMDRIVVEGETVYGYDEVAEKCGVEMGTNLLSINMKEISDRLIKELSYIDKADVSWGFPTTLKVTLNQAAAVANVERNGVYYLISENGRIMNAELKAPDKKYPVVYGFDPEYAVSGDFLAVADEGSRNLVCKLLSAVKKYDGLAPTGEKSVYDKKEILFSVFELLKDVKLSEKIKAVDISNIYGIKLNYDNRITLEMGEFTEFALKLRIADNLIAKGEFNGEKGALILSSVSSSSDSMKATFRPDHTEDTSSDDTSSNNSQSSLDTDSSQTDDNGNDETSDGDDEPSDDDEQPDDEPVDSDDEQPVDSDEEPDEEPYYGDEDSDEEPYYGDEDSDEEPYYGDEDSDEESYYDDEDPDEEPYYGDNNTDNEPEYGGYDADDEPYYGGDEDYD